MYWDHSKQELEQYDDTLAFSRFLKSTSHSNREWFNMQIVICNATMSIAENNIYFNVYGQFQTLQSYNQKSENDCIHQQRSPQNGSESFQ